MRLSSLYNRTTLRLLGLFLGGALLSFTFAPYDIGWPLAWLVVLYLYHEIQHLTPKQGLFAGALFGFGYFGLGVNWVYHSVHLFGEAVAPLAAAVTLLFVAVMTVFPAVCVYLFLRLRQRVPVLWHAWLFASLWVLLELARGKIMGGFPWILLGYSQTSAPLASLAPVMGVYGMSLVIAWFLPQLYDLERYYRHKLNVVVLWAGLLGMAGVLSFAVFTAGKIEFTQAKDSRLSVRLVQANIPQSLKFSRERLQNSITDYTTLSLENKRPVDLIIWPETAIPTYFNAVESVLQPFAQQLKKQGTEVLTGGFSTDGNTSYNSVRQLAGDQALYQKRHLVPFGEYMPFRSVLNHLAQYIEIPMSDLGEGAGPNVPLLLSGELIGVSICYEDAFGEEMREQLPAATVLVNVSNDAWFGDSAAPYQHQQKAQMRAREMGRPMVRVTNNGVSSVINYQGQIQGSIAHNTQGVLDAEVTPRTGVTWYVQTGNWPVGVWVWCVLGVVCLRRLWQR